MLETRQLLVNVLGATYDPTKHTVTLRLGRAKNHKTLGTLEILGLTDALGQPGGNTDVSVNLQSPRSQAGSPGAGGMRLPRCPRRGHNARVPW